MNEPPRRQERQGKKGREMEGVIFNVARGRLLSRLQLPESTAIQLLETILMRDELYKQELIGDRQVLEDLLRVLKVSA